MREKILRLALSAIALVAAAGIFHVRAGETLRLSLDDAIRVAADSSLTAFRNKNLYYAGYWQWRSFKAARLPQISLELDPARYYRYITQRYDSEQNIDVFRSQQIYSASAGLSVTQNVDFLGGEFFLESDIEYLRNFGDMTGNQFSTVPVRLGYRQNLLGFNARRWERRIEPLRYEKVKREFIANMEALSENVVDCSFELAPAQTELRLARENLEAGDTLYTVGERRFRIASISKSELLSLKLDKVNARNALENARIQVKRASLRLASCLGLDSDTDVEVVIPGKPAIPAISPETALAMLRENSPALMEKRQLTLEAEREVSRTRAEARFNASVNASVGFNQVATTFPQAYRNPMRQDIVALTIAIPLVDWGVRKGKYNMALSNLNLARADAGQLAENIGQELLVAIDDMTACTGIIDGAAEALDIAEEVYSGTCTRFMIGKADINSIVLAQSRRSEAMRNYIAAIKSFWLNHYKIRRLTFYDFDMQMSISRVFDIDADVR